MNRKTSLSLIAIPAQLAETVIILLNQNSRPQTGAQLPKVIFILVELEALLPRYKNEGKSRLK